MQSAANESSSHPSQSVYWDHESDDPAYCQRHLDAMSNQNLQGMFDKGLKTAGISPGNLASALEIGGGSQILSRQLLHHNPRIKITCTDISQVRVDAFAAHYGDSLPNLILRGGVDAQTLPFDDHAFDLICGDAVLHHIDCLKKALLEINRCLAPGGTALFFREPVVGYLGLQTYALLQRCNRDEIHIQRNRFEYKRTLEQWMYEFITAGFRPRVMRRWPRQGISAALRSSVPSMFPCYVGFILHKWRDTKELGLNV